MGKLVPRRDTSVRHPAQTGSEHGELERPVAGLVPRPGHSRRHEALQGELLWDEEPDGTRVGEGMSATISSRRRLSVSPMALMMLLAVGLIVGASGILVVGMRAEAAPVAVGQVPSVVRTAPEAEAPAQDQPVAAPAAEVAPPVRVTIPSIGVDSLLVGLRVQPDGALAAPTVVERAGWWRDGPAPGAPGAAIVAGHIDSQEGPAVFYKLKKMKPGETVDVLRADGTTATFVVDAVAQYPKDEFPDDLVYQSGDQPTLRLVTCGGVFDNDSRHYLDNIVVFASLQDAPGTPA